MAKPALEDLRTQAAACTDCDLYRDATQTVFGGGATRARLMLVGEQPGDREDIEGEPFVGPAGRVLERALVQAGIDRADAYVTNVVKHFKFRRQGKRRIHQKPNAAQIRACSQWLDAELDAVRPQLLIALGATAAKALLGNDFRVSRQRGEIRERDGLRITATVHPSSILRGPDDERERAFEAFVDDLRNAAALLS